MQIDKYYSLLANSLNKKRLALVTEKYFFFVSLIIGQLLVKSLDVLIKIQFSTAC